MTTVLFNEWLRQFDRAIRSEGRHVLLLLDNCSAHQQTIEISNIEVRFFPPNTTATLQPMDQGVIQNLKVHYRGLLLRRVIAEVEAGNNSAFKVNLREALRYLSRAWQMVTENTIANCFKKAGCLPISTAEDHMGDDDESTEYEGLFERLRSATTIPEGFTFHLFTTADDELVARAALSDEDIISAALASDQAEEIEEDEEESHSEVAQNAAEAYRCLDLLRGFVENKSKAYDPKPFNEIEEMLGSIVEKTSIQTKIDSFFHRRNTQ